MSNSDIFAKLLSAAFTVELKRGGETFKLTVRDLPFSTLSFIIGEFTTSARQEITDARKRAVEEILQIGSFGDFDPSKYFDMFLPLITAAVLNGPDLLKRVLKDTVHEITDEQVALLSVEDVTAIVEAILKRMDKQQLSEKISSIFLQAKGVFSLVQENLPQPEKEIQKTTEEEVSTSKESTS